MSIPFHYLQVSLTEVETALKSIECKVLCYSKMLILISILMRDEYFHMSYYKSYTLGTDLIF